MSWERSLARFSSNENQQRFSDTLQKMDALQQSAQDTASVLDASNASLELSEKLQTMSKTYRDSSEHMLGVARKFKV